MITRNRPPRIAKSAVLSTQRRAISLMKTMNPKPVCDQGGCLGHVGTRCSMDDAWELAMERAQDELAAPEEIA